MCAMPPKYRLKPRIRCINYAHLLSIRSDEVILWTRMAMIFAFRLSSGNKTKPSVHRPNRTKECHTINSTWFHWTDPNAIHFRQIFRCWISAAPAKYVEIEISKDVFMLYISILVHFHTQSSNYKIFRTSNRFKWRMLFQVSMPCERHWTWVDVPIHTTFHALAISQQHNQMEMIWRVYPKINYVVSIYSTGIDYCAGTLMMFPSPSDSVRMIEFEYNLPIDFCKVKIPTNIQIAFRTCVGECVYWAMVMAPMAYTCQ